MLKIIVKKLALRYYPTAAFTYRAAIMRRHFRKAFLARQMRMKARIYGDANPTVLSGPFAGMKYLNETVWGPIECKWLGTYEQELAPAMNRIERTIYSTIIDIGSAEGYYSVGLARQFPTVPVRSFDVDPWARSQQRRLALLNRVNNLSIDKRCSSAVLNDCIAGLTLLVCDVEGYEYDLLDPIKAPCLEQCDILVELHDQAEQGFTIASGSEEMKRRFSTSHRITTFAVTPRSLEAVEGLVPESVTPEELADCMDEYRSENQLWLWLEAHVA